MVTKIEKRRHKKGAMINQDTQYKEGLKIWVSYWRANINRFLEDYIGCTELKIFQKILLYLMSVNVNFVYTASRGQGKSMLVSWFACIMSILYPGIEIVVTSGTKSQAKLLISEKVEKFAEKYPNLKNEILKINRNASEIVVLFKNGSSITCVAPTETSRGYRANILIIDEFRQVKKDIIDTVLKRFLASNRSPKFLARPEYDGFPMDEFEPNRIVYMSSCWFKNHWSWEKFTDTVNQMISLSKDGEEYYKTHSGEEVAQDKLKSYCAISIPYTAPLYHGILPLTTVEDEMDEDGFSEVKWMMEMEALFYGESELAYYKINDIEEVMNVRNILYPDCILPIKKKSELDFWLEDKSDGEIRIIATDVGEKGTDNDVHICIRCIPKEYGRGDNKKMYYHKEVVFIKHIQCDHPEKKAIFIKRLKEDFDADYVVMDTNGTSSSLYYACNKKTIDEERGCTYDAWTAFNDDKLDSLKIDDDALKIVYSVRAFAQFNHECANRLKDELRAKRISLPLSRSNAMSELTEELDGFTDLSIKEREDMLQTYYETDLLLIELTNLEAIWSDKGLVSIEKPKGGKVKRDRYSALSYGIWFCCEKEMENLNRNRKKKKSSLSSLFLYN